MASLYYGPGLADMINDVVDFDGDTIKAMLVGTGYTPSVDHTALDMGGADDPTDEELSGTGYAGGHGGSGRKTLTTCAVTYDAANNRVKFTADSVVWPGIDAGTIAGVIVFKPGTSNDTTARPLFFIDVTDLLTNGGDVTLTWASAGVGVINV